jgi:MFS family permease
MITVKNAWLVALIFIPFGSGAVVDKISLNAHLKSILGQSGTHNPKISSLGSVMSFLYSSYIIIYAVLNPLLGKYIDHVYSTSPTIRPALIYTAGVQITVVSIIVFLSTFIPNGSSKLNPTIE